MQILLHQLKIDIPIKKLIVFAYSNTHIVLPPQSCKITMGCDISEHIEEYNKLPDVISVKAFNRLLLVIKSNSTEFMPIPLAKTYNLELADIRTGLICTICHLKIANKKSCPTCKISRTIMQKQAIEDWFYLYKNTMTNSECVNFLELKDKFAANYLLNKLQLERINNHRYRRYTLSQSFLLTKESSPTL